MHKIKDGLLNTDKYDSVMHKINDGLINTDKYDQIFRDVDRLLREVRFIYEMIV